MTLTATVCVTATALHCSGCFFVLLTEWDVTPLIFFVTNKEWPTTTAAHCNNNSKIDHNGFLTSFSKLPTHRFKRLPLDYSSAGLPLLLFCLLLCFSTGGDVTCNPSKVGCPSSAAYRQYLVGSLSLSMRSKLFILVPIAGHVSFDIGRCTWLFLVHW